MKAGEIWVSDIGDRIRLVKYWPSLDSYSYDILLDKWYRAINWPDESDKLKTREFILKLYTKESNDSSRIKEEVITY